MSFDEIGGFEELNKLGLNPFGTGQCLSTNIIINIGITICLNPFGTGQCLSTYASLVIDAMLFSLNPFGTGQCLSTLVEVKFSGFESVSIPLEQGNVFRLVNNQNFKAFDASQSLWNRAMSFDCSGGFKPCVARLPRATSQLFLMPEESGINLIKY